jgi:glycosyltransferase involved in cell wall biosynthesis
MLLHGTYPWDERVSREADALHDAGYSVDVFCLMHHPDEPAEDVVRGVRVFRVPMSRSRSDSSMVYVREYSASLATFLGRLTSAHRRQHYDLVQIHTLPDFLAFSALPAKLAGARLVLDIHDLMPELYQSKYGLGERSAVVRVLRMLESASRGICDHVITASEAFKQRLVSRGVPEGRVTVVLNTADPAIFPAPLVYGRPKLEGGLEIVWHGTMVERYGVDLMLHACALVRDEIPGLRLTIYGSGEKEDALLALHSELGLDGVIDFGGHRPHAEIPALISRADVGIVANRPDVHIDMAYPTKLFEFVQMGIPVISTRTEVLEGRFGDDALIFCDATAESIADAIRWTACNREEARVKARRAREQCEAISWEQMGAVYVEAIARTIGR